MTTRSGVWLAISTANPSASASWWRRWRSERCEMRIGSAHRGRTTGSGRRRRQHIDRAWQDAELGWGGEALHFPVDHRLDAPPPRADGHRLDVLDVDGGIAPP